MNNFITAKLIKRNCKPKEIFLAAMSIERNPFDVGDRLQLGYKEGLLTAKAAIGVTFACPHCGDKKEVSCPNHYIAINSDVDIVCSKCKKKYNVKCTMDLEIRIKKSKNPNKISKRIVKIGNKFLKITVNNIEKTLALYQCIEDGFNILFFLTSIFLQRRLSLSIDYNSECPYCKEKNDTVLINNCTVAIHCSKCKKIYYIQFDSKARIDIKKYNKKSNKKKK